MHALSSINTPPEKSRVGQFVPDTGTQSELIVGFSPTILNTFFKENFLLLAIFLTVCVWRGLQICRRAAGWALKHVQQLGGLCSLARALVPVRSMSSQTGNPTLPSPSSASLPMKYKLQRGPRGRTWYRKTPTPSVLCPLFCFFFTCQRRAEPLRLSNMCCSYSVCFKSSCLPFFCELRFSCDQRTVNVFPASFLCSHVLISTCSTFY